MQALGETSEKNDLPDLFPRDRHNDILISNVHPANWRNPAPASHYNLVVIGAGTAGLVTAAGAAGLGAPLRALITRIVGGNMEKVTYDKEISALLVIDPYNDFISEGGKAWDRLKAVAEANNCVPNMLQVLNAARKAGLRVFYALHHRYRHPLITNPRHKAENPLLPGCSNMN